MRKEDFIGVNQTDDGMSTEIIHGDTPTLKESFILYPYRWIMQLAFSFAISSTSVLMVGFSPIASVISKLFDCSIVIVELQTLIFLAAFIPANFTAIHLLPKKGLRWTILAGGTLLLIGAWLRILVNITGRFELASFGSVFAAFGQTFFYNCISRLATQWFGERERTISTTLSGISIPIGSIVGFVLPSILVTESDMQDVDAGRHKIMLYIGIQCAIVTIAVINLFIHTVDKPLTAPSISASLEQPTFDFKTEYKSLINNKDYLLLAISFGSLYANSGALGAIISAITLPYGYRIRDNAIFGAAFILSGILGAIAGGFLTEKYRKFKLSIQVVCLLASILTSMTLFTLPTGSVALLALNLGLIGFSLIPVMPLSFAFAVELTYPTPEAMSNGMMLLPSKIYGALLGLITAAACQWDPKYAIAFFIMNTLIATAASFYIKEDLKRMRMEQQ